MKAIAVIPGKKQSAHLRDVSIPTINDDEVLVRSMQAGICGTDREIHEGLYGTAPKNKEYLILGHESSGIVAQVGKNVSGISIGQQVVRLVRRPCPECENCSEGRNDMCSTGNFVESGIKELQGCMAEYFKDEPRYLVPIPSELSKVGVLLEPLSVVEKAYRQATEIQCRLSWKPKKALIMGAGPIGILQAMLLQDLGLDVVVLARSLPENKKSNLIEKIGALYVSTSQYSLDDISKSFGKIDFIVEASGDSQLAFEALRLVGNNGVVCLTSITGGGKKLTIPADKINLEYVLGNKVAFGTVNANSIDYQQGVRSLERFMDRWPEVLPEMITRRVPLAQFEQALQPAQEDIKVVLEIDK